MSAVVSGRGLHPGFGVLHSIDDGHDACVYDLVEIFRAGLVEGVVLNLFNTRVLRPEHFTEFQGGKRLNSSTFSAIIRDYEERAESLVKSVRSDKRITWRRLMIEQAEAYAVHVEGGKAFQPYVMDY
jgi:CRISP-associated protein Cas1